MSTNIAENVLGECKVELSPGCSVVGEVTKLSNPKLDQVREVKRFLGVPYGESPVGDLMFKDPVPIKPWQGERQAKHFGPACPQHLGLVDMLPIKVAPPAQVGEDCLHLNVWTPNTSSEAKLPVMVWFYGGGFMSGYTDFYNGAGLTNFHDVVVVAVSYRVGVWGFLCTGDGAATGNYGLLDQVESLRWVQKNINKFGGDPSNVTIFGESAGGASTAFHMVSPLSRGLFKNCISQSGTVLVMGEAKTQAEGLEALKPYLKHIGCESTDGKEIIAFLKSLPTDKLVLPWELMSASVFVPVVDGKMIKGKSDITLSKDNLSKVNHLIGVNSDEGAIMAALVCQLFHKEFKDVDLPTASEMIKATLAQRYCGKDVTKLSEAVVKDYLGDVEPGDKMLHSLMHLLGDTTFVIPAIITANAQSAQSTVYLYSYQIRNSFTKYPEFVRADHGYEVPLMFGMPFGVEDSGFTKEEETLSRKMMSYWTNFAKTGNPNGSGLEHWPEYTSTERKYIVLDDPITESADLRGQKVKFWNEAPAKYIS